MGYVPIEASSKDQMNPALNLVWCLISIGEDLVAQWTDDLKQVLSIKVVRSHQNGGVYERLSELVQENVIQVAEGNKSALKDLVDPGKLVKFDGIRFTSNTPIVLPNSVDMFEGRAGVFESADGGFTWTPTDKYVNFKITQEVKDGQPLYKVEFSAYQLGQARGGGDRQMYLDNLGVYDATDTKLKDFYATFGPTLPSGIIPPLV